MTGTESNQLLLTVHGNIKCESEFGTHIINESPGVTSLHQSNANIVVLDMPNICIHV